MRLGVLSDVHGNLQALEAVLEVLAAERVSHYLCAGDLVGYGPQPNECVEVIRALGATCVAGNHDLIAAGRLGDEGIGALARQTLQWTAQALEPSARRYLAGLPQTLASHDVMLAHGTLDDPRVKVRTAAQALEQLTTMEAREPELRLLVLGHTHVPFAYSRQVGRLAAGRPHPIDLHVHDRWLLNPGGVGQARGRRVLARCLVVDLVERRARFVAVPYDVEACDRALLAQGLPRRTYHLKPAPLHRRARRYARRLVRNAEQQRRRA